MLTELIIRLADRVLDRLLTPETKRQRTIRQALPELRRRRDELLYEYDKEHTQENWDKYKLYRNMVWEYEEELRR